MNDFSKIDALPTIKQSKAAITSNLLDVSLGNAKQTDPDMEVKYNSISNEFGMPVNFVRDNYDSVSKMVVAKQEDPKVFATKFPKSSAWLTNQDNANLSSDSIEQLQKYEETLSKINTNKAIDDTGGLAAWGGKIIANRGATVTGNFIKFVGKAYDAYAALHDTSRYFLPESIDKAAVSLRNIPSDYLEMAGDSLKSAQFDTPNIDTWGNLKGDPTDINNLVNFVVSQSGSVVDMFGAAYAFPAYYASLSEEVTSNRAANKDSKQASAKDYAIGISTALVMALVERVGAKAVLGSFLDDAARVTSIKQIPTAIAKASATESVTEGIQEGSQYFGETVLTDKDLSLSEGADRALSGAVGGFMMGGGIRGSIAGFEASTNTKYQNRINQALNKQVSELKVGSEESIQARHGEAGIQNAISQLRDMAAVGRGADIQSLSQSIVEEGGPKDLSFNAQAMVDAAIKNNLDVGDVSIQLFGSRSTLEMSAKANTAISIPTAKYMSSDLALKAHEDISHTMLLDDNQMTLEDAQEFDAGLSKNISEGVEFVNNEWNQDDSAVNDVYTQLLARGYTHDSAKASAGIYRFMNVMKERGVSAELIKEFKLSIGRQGSNELQSTAQGPEFNSMIDDLRNGRTPQPKDYNGENIVDFIAGRGGIAKGLEDGDGLMDGITTIAGISTEQMANDAFEAGFIAKPEPELLLNAIDSTTKGNEVFSEKNIDTGVRDRAVALESLSIDLDTAGIDINDMTNDEISRFLSDAGVNALNQSADKKNLVLTHNISADGIRAANDLGGLAAPSLAVSNVDVQGFENFGDITLMMDSSALDDKTLRTFDADIYSPRQPRSDDKIDHNKKQALISDIENSIEGTNLVGPRGEVDNKHSLDTQGSMYHFLNTIDKAPKPKKMKETIISKIAKGLSSAAFKENKAFVSAVANKYNTMLAEVASGTTDQGFIDDVAKTWFSTSLPAGVEIRQVGDEYQGFDGEEEVGKPLSSKSLAKRRTITILERDGIKGDIDYTQPKTDILQNEYNDASAINDGVDIKKLTSDIQNKMNQKGISEAYNKWLDDSYNSLVSKKRIFKGYTDLGNRKYKDYTMKNVVAEMTKQLQGGENSQYGVASVRAIYASEMKTKKDVQENRDRFVTVNEMEDIKSESEQKFEDLLDELKIYYTGDTDGWGYAEDVASSIIDGPKGVLEAFGGSREASALINKFGGYLASLPTEYFESKAQRAVNFSEFDTAIIPTNTPADIVNILKSNGLKIKKYTDQDGKTRNDVIRKQTKLLFQQDRGNIQIDRENKKYKINLDENFDMSTFLHESSHFFFEVMTDTYNAGEGNEQLRADYEILVDHLGGTAGEKLNNQQLESFAEMFEQYLREGKAPSKDLEAAFAGFKMWLGNIYKSVKDIFTAGNKELNDDVRQVMDRMLATDAEISAVNDGLNLNQLITKKPEWFTDEMWADYQADQVVRKERQESELNQKKIAQVDRVQDAWWKNELKKVTDAVTEDANSMGVYQLLALLRSKSPVTAAGEKLEGVVHYSLDKQETINLMGDIFVNGGVDASGNKISPSLPRSVYTKKDRSPVPPQILFESYADEFNTAFDMIQEMANAKPKSEFIKDRSNTVMNEKFGSIETIKADAYMATIEAAHDEYATADAMINEINYFVPITGGYRVTRNAFKRSAESILSGLTLQSIRPNNFRRMEVKHGDKAFKAMEKGDYAVAKKERELQLLNFYLYNQSIKIKDKEEKGYKYARSMEKGTRLETLKKAGDHYIEQMASVLNQYEFKKMSNKQLINRKKMNDWIDEALESAGAGDPTVKDDLKDAGEKVTDKQERAENDQSPTPNFEAETDKIINYRELTTIEFDIVQNMIKTIHSLAANKNKLMKAKDKADFYESRDTLVSSIKEAGGDKIVSDEDVAEDLALDIESVLTSSRSPASVIKELDAMRDGGIAWELLDRPLTEGESESAQRIEVAKRELAEIWNTYSGKELKEMQIDRFDEVTGKTVSRYKVLSFLMNWGTKSNRDRVMSGHNLTKLQVEHLFDTYLTKSDIDFANKMWANLETYWKSASDLHKDFFGYTPTKVSPVSFSTRLGDLTGGYYPIKYDSTKSSRAEQNEAKNILDKTFKSAASKVKMGSTQERTAKGLGKPLLLDVNKVTTGHVFDTVRKTSMNRAIYDAGRIISDEKVKKAIVDNFGVTKYTIIKEGILKSRDGIQETATGHEKIVNSIRNNASLAMLGFSLRTIALQPFGLTNSLAKLNLAGVGRMDTLNSFARYISNPAKAMRYIKNKSIYMKNREITQNVEIARLSKQMKAGALNGRISRITNFITDRAMLLMMKVQLYIVDGPTWMAANDHYAKYYTEDKATLLSDQAVKESQGGGDTLDIARSMNGGAWSKLFTNFLSYMMTTYNLQVQNTKVNQPIKSMLAGDFVKVFKYVENTILLLLMPAALNMALNAFTSGDSPDDAEGMLISYAKELASFMLGMNPITAQFDGVFSGFSYSGPQGFTVIGKVISLAKSLDKDEDLDELLTSESVIKNGIWVTGLLTGLPAAQINRTIWGVKQANDNREGTGQTIKQGLFGKEYKK